MPSFAGSAARIGRQLALPFAYSLTLHGAAFYGWHSPLLYASIGRAPDAIHARLALPPAPAPSPAPPSETLAPEPEPETSADPAPEPAAPVAAAAEPPAPHAPPEYLAGPLTDVPASPLQEIEPAYPEDPDLQALEGRVVLRILINERGAVDRVIVEDTGGLPARFAETAGAAFLAARFQPARRGGEPVKSQMRVEVRFGAGTP